MTAPSTALSTFRGLVATGLLTLTATLSAPWPVGLAQEAAPLTPQAVWEKMREANRYWLGGPPERVGTYQYVFHLGDNPPMAVKVVDPKRVGSSKRQGLSYHSPLHAALQNPGEVKATSATQTPEGVVLTLSFDPTAKVAYGNGVEGTWRGYFSTLCAEAKVEVDTTRWVPKKVTFEGVKESFGDYVEADPGHWVPLSVGIVHGEMKFEWLFKLYRDGLWLLDRSEYRGARVAWVDGVEVGTGRAEVVQSTAEAHEHAKSEATGKEALARMLEANRNWLMPLHDVGHPLAYRYRQEEPYTEDVIFDREQMAFVQLTATKDSPNQPTRQMLWLPDGRRVDGQATDKYVSVSPAPTAGQGDARHAWGDRRLQNLAAGLGWDCALTKAVREPDAFAATVQSAPGDDQRYVLVLRPEGRARLFAGTMLAFSSWAYMHDIDYARSEIVCDAATHHPLKETDYDGEGRKVGEFTFSNYVNVCVFSAPRAVQGIIPYEKDGKDQSLEMNAVFGSPRPGVWLLSEVSSAFRGGGGSTGRVEVLERADETLALARELRERFEQTARVKEQLASAPEGQIDLQLQPGGWVPVLLKAKWEPEAAKSWTADAKRGQPKEAAIIGLLSARLTSKPGGGYSLEWEGLSTAHWQEYEVRWTVTGTGSDGSKTELVMTNRIRCEGAPTAFTNAVEAPGELARNATGQLSLGIAATVDHMSGMYHGHGIWMQLGPRFRSQ